jgi:hypothetical protein
VGWNGDPTISITLHFRDDDQAVSRNIINVAAGLLGSVGSFATSYPELYRPLSSCALWKVSISYRTIDDSSPTASSGAQNSRVGVLLFDTAATSPERYAVIIPSIKDSLVISDPLDPDRGIGLKLTHPAIVALRDALISGLAGVAPVAPWNVSGDPWGDGGPGSDFDWSGVALTALVRAYRGFEELTPA